MPPPLAVNDVATACAVANARANSGAPPRVCVATRDRHLGCEQYRRRGIAGGVENALFASPRQRRSMGALNGRNAGGARAGAPSCHGCGAIAALSAAAKRGASLTLPCRGTRFGGSELWRLSKEWTWNETRGSRLRKQVPKARLLLDAAREKVGDADSEKLPALWRAQPVALWCHGFRGATAFVPRVPPQAASQPDLQKSLFSSPSSTVRKASPVADASSAAPTPSSSAPES
mmetsp:Transcript_18662/g.51191  ORF Transcript_18662/g.51191 Transcript_18662/m.51191 type:complete len:232 (+) Transcript_18662:398-1093(+)